jgi:hypothetical protein
VNDPDRRHSSGASDYDAIFADIVAHLNDDDVMEAEEAVRPDTGDADHDTEVVPASGKDAGKESPSDAPADPAAGQVDQADQPSDQKSPDNDPVSDSVALSGEVPLGERDPWSVPLPPLMPRQEDLRDPLHEDEDAGPSPQVWRAHDIEEYEDHFEPPVATPLPAGDLQFWAIIAGMGGGPLLLLYLVFFNRDASSYWILTAIALCVGGFALLVSRMPGNHGDDDDGARL